MAGGSSSGDVNVSVVNLSRCRLKSETETSDLLCLNRGCVHVRVQTDRKQDFSEQAAALQRRGAKRYVRKSASTPGAKVNTEPDPEAVKPWTKLTN